jgi:hypothetical protein
MDLAHSLQWRDMKVEKEKFDDLLQRMLKQESEKTSTIKSGKKAGTIIPPKTAQSQNQQ